MKPIFSTTTFALTSLIGTSAAFAQGSLAGQETSVPGGTLMLVAYIALWVLIFGFVFVTLRRQQKLDRELDTLERRMDEVFEELK